MTEPVFCAVQEPGPGAAGRVGVLAGQPAGFLPAPALPPLPARLPLLRPAGRLPPARVPGAWRRAAGGRVRPHALHAPALPCRLPPAHGPTGQLLSCGPAPQSCASPPPPPCSACHLLHYTTNHHCMSASLQHSSPHSCTLVHTH